MKKIVKYSLIAVLSLALIIQFIPVELPENKEDYSNDLLQTAVVPEEVTNILKTSCYDCHSTQTHYPWYSHVAPASWIVARDVRDGRKELNLSDWASLSKRKQLRSLNDIAEVVEKKEMPMKIYTAIHGDAVLDEAEIALLVNWAGVTAESMLQEDEEDDDTEINEENEEEDGE